MGKQNVYLVILICIILAGCQTAAAPTAGPDTPEPLPEQAEPGATPTIEKSAADTPVLSDWDGALPPFTIDWDEPVSEGTITGESITLAQWEAQPYAGTDIELPLALDQVVNPGVTDELTREQTSFLQKNGFVVIHSQEEQFNDIREETAHRSGQPYYLTVDAAYHAMHLLFDDLLKSLEGEYLRQDMIDITRITLDQVSEYSNQVQGTDLEEDAQQAVAYLSVALKLFDPEAKIDSTVEDIVNQEVQLIMAAGGPGTSVVIPGFREDYGAYKPVGHYAGDPGLEAYFRGMTWYGRVHFLLQDPSIPDFVPSRVPLIVTLALRRAQLEDQPASDAWADIHRVLTFIIGPSDDLGPMEYAELMDQVFGTSPTIQDLADEDLWQEFLSRSEQLPAPQINSMLYVSTVDLSPGKGWRFMGQRFTIDGMVFQNLIYDRLEEKPDGTKRELPSGLDVMAAFGSLPAYDELASQGVTDYPNYIEQLEVMQQAVEGQSEEQWLGRFYDNWLYSLFPVIHMKDPSYPAYMQTAAWNYRELNAALGSWAELKHDTVLYVKMPDALGAGGPPVSAPAPSYVEANPEAFYRLAYMAQMLSCGLQNLVLHGLCYLEEGAGYPPNADGYIFGMGSLGNRLQKLGDIAVKELSGQELDESDNYIITGCLGMIECMYADSSWSRPEGEMPKVPVVAAVSGGVGGNILEAGVGDVDRIYVVVPLEGQFEIAQGGVFSYYEFSQPRDNRLTDDEWRAKLAGGGVEMPLWASNFVMPGGHTIESLFFRVGDIYFITEEGDELNLRDQPSLEGAVIIQLKENEYIEIIDGPVQADGYTWWKIKVDRWGSEGEITGWAVEDQLWYVRSY